MKRASENIEGSKSFDSTKKKKISERCDVLMKQHNVENNDIFLNLVYSKKERKGANRLFVKGISIKDDLQHLKKILSSNLGFTSIYIETVHDYSVVADIHRLLYEMLTEYKFDDTDNHLELEFKVSGVEETTEKLQISTQLNNVRCSFYVHFIDGLYNELIVLLKKLANTSRKVVIRANVVSLKRIYASMNWDMEDAVKTLLRKTEEERTMTEFLSGPKDTRKINYPYHLQVQIDNDNNSYYIDATGSPVFEELEFATKKEMDDCLTKADGRTIFILLTSPVSEVNRDPLCAEVDRVVYSSLRDPAIVSRGLLFIKFMGPNAHEWLVMGYHTIQSVPLLMKYGVPKTVVIGKRHFE